MIRFALLLPLCLVLAVGCAAPRYGLETCRPGKAVSTGGKSVAESARYQIRTDTGPAAAAEVLAFMESAADLWIPLFGDPDPDVLPLRVRLYRQPDDLARLLKSRGLSPRATGLYLPGPSAAIHLACYGHEPGHPYHTLLHEGTHQFVHLVGGSRAGDRGGRRVGIPLWLNEGLAVYFEGALVSPRQLRAGRPAADRLACLQRALRREKLPDLETVMKRRYGQSFAPIDYAVAWGVVYALMQEPPAPWARGGRSWVKGILEQSRQGWSGKSHAATVVAGGRETGGRASPAEIVWREFDHFLESGGWDVSGWQARWEDWIRLFPGPDEPGGSK